MACLPFSVIEEEVVLLLALHLEAGAPAEDVGGLPAHGVAQVGPGSMVVHSHLDRAGLGSLTCSLRFGGSSL